MPRSSRCHDASKLLRRQFHASTQRPPRKDFFCARLHQSRSFTSRSSLLVTSRSLLRPQLPFLHPYSRRPNFSSQLARFTTETKARWKAGLKRQLRVQAYFWPAVALIVLFSQGLKQTQLENEYPTPHDWSFWSRWHLRTGKYLSEDDPEKLLRIKTRWEDAGISFTTLLQRLEDEALDGKGLIKGETLVDGVGRTGFDVSLKSEPWRRGYYQALMSAGKCAEHLEGMAKRKGDRGDKLIPWESIPGPRNPRPKPMAWQKDGSHLNVPSEEECEDAFPSPEKFYMKILTTNGFTNGQRLDAALAYADWCDYSGLHETARDMYDWALDIATGGLPVGANGVVDVRTGVFNRGKDEMVTSNLLKATTALGVHHARKGEVQDALPIFLSVLRARKSLPAQTGGKGAVTKQKKADEDPILAALRTVKDFLFDTPYPPASPSGDERPVHTLQEACEEVGLMTYIGEILFATSSNEREKGLSWTRDSVDGAEAIMWVMDEQKEHEGRETCRQCLETGLRNWKEMANQMAKLAIRREEEAEKSGGWLGLGLGKGSKVEAAKKEVQRWKEESHQAELRWEKTITLTKPLKPISGGWLSV